MFNQLGNFADLLKNAGKIREAVEKAGETLSVMQFEGTAGGGAVTARVNGRLEMVAVRIDPKLASDGDVELLEDLVLAATNHALGKAREEAARSMTGALPMGNLGQMFGPGAGGA